MNTPSTLKDESSAAADPHCLMRSVSNALAAEPNLEAVTLDQNGQTISVATMSRPANEALADRIRASVREAQDATSASRCTLWDGNTECAECAIPLTTEERRRLRVEHKDGKTTIARVTCPTAPSFWRWSSFPWPKVVQRDVEFFEHAGQPDDWKPQLLAAALCGVFGLIGLFQGHATVKVFFYLLAYGAGGWFTVEEVWERLRQRSIDVHFLMLAVAAGSASIGAWGEGAMLLFLFSLSGALEHFALARTQREIHALFKNAPKVATVIDESGHDHEVSVEQLRPGMRLLIKPGSQFAVDCEIAKGQTAADESNLTGESVPVEKRIGDTVLAGTLNLWGAVEAVVLHAASESALQKIIRLIRDAQQQKAPAQRFTDKFSSVYTYGVLAATLAMFFVWWKAFGLPAFTGPVPTATAFYRAMTLLVVASPCALVLSIPSAVLAAIATAARRGILFRGGAAVEKLADVRVVALDKTGTLTTGDLQVASVASFPPGREHEVAQMAYSLERLSTHPLARAITRYGKRQGLEPLALDHFESVTGQGLQARRGDDVFMLGRRDWLASGPHRDALSKVPPPLPGASEVWLAGNGLLGCLLLRDDVRPQAALVIQELRRAGLRHVVLTGDRRGTAELLKLQLRLDDVRAELKPEEKVNVINTLEKAGLRVAMIGDGVNDAPSLAAAHVGVAMGARGADAALEQADIVLMNDRLENFLVAFRLSQRAQRVIRQNLVISLGTVAVLVLFALAGSIPLTLGVIGHEGSTVVVVMNSLRLLLRRAKEA